MSILLDDDEIFSEQIASAFEIVLIKKVRNKKKQEKLLRLAIAKAQAKKILIELQAIYNLPDEGMFHKKMGEYIQELLECIR